MTLNILDFSSADKLLQSTCHENLKISHKTGNSQGYGGFIVYKAPLLT